MIIEFVIICNEIYSANSVMLFMMNFFVRSGLIITGKLEYYPKKRPFLRKRCVQSLLKVIKMNESFKKIFILKLEKDCFFQKGSVFLIFLLFFRLL